MFNLGFQNHDPIDFSSNPSLTEGPVFKPGKDEKGNVKNELLYEPRSNRGVLDGVHYTAETMSLRALLNLGVKLDRVSFGQTENDPTILQRHAVAFEEDIYKRLEELQHIDISAASPSVSPAATSSVDNYDKSSNP